MESLIIYGGSFDPIHNGHLRIAHAASLYLNADVVFVPARSPRWKTPRASAKDRLKMLRLALKEDFSTAFSIDLFEMNSKQETNYTIDTVRYFAKKYPDHRLYLLIGADQVNTFDQWKDAKAISEFATPLYVARPGIPLDDHNLTEYSMMRLDYDKSGSVSSTAVRSLQSADIPLSVRDYIEENELYYMDHLASLISRKRLIHSVSVAKLAYSIAQKSKLENYRDAYIAGLLHDCAKNMPKSAQEKITKEVAPEFGNGPSWMFHQFAGAYVARRDFGITDEAVLTAIRYHASGRPHMTPLEKIIYSADKIDPTRGYDSSQMIEACLRNYYVGFLTVLEANRDFLRSQGYIVDNRLTQECFDLYLGD